MRGAKRRFRRLESQIVAAVADQPDAYALAATPVRAVPGASMPKVLIDAARRGGEAEFSALVELAGATVAVRVSGEGDPREWWTVIWGIVGPEASDSPESDIRIERLPAGLSAIAVNWASGELVVSISGAIEPGRQRAAALAAVRAALGPPARRQPNGSADRAPRARAVAAIGAVILLTAAVTSVLALAEHGQDRQAKLADPGTPPKTVRSVPTGRAAHTGRQPTAGEIAPRTSPDPTPSKHRGTKPSPSAGPTARPAPSPTPSPSSSPRRSPRPPPSSASSPPPDPSPTPSASPTPTPTPSPSPSKGCVTILGIRLCL